MHGRTRPFSAGYRGAKKVELDEIPNCDFCQADGVTKPGLYDSPTIKEAGGQWASMCDEHMRVYGIHHPGLTRKRVLRGTLHQDQASPT